MKISDSSELVSISDHSQKYIEIGYNIAYYRKHHNLTQEELAELVGISRWSYVKI